MKTLCFRSNLLLLFIAILSVKANGQCPITVDAGPDKFVCEIGESTLLNGSINGPYIGLNWTPETGLDDPMSLTPSATVTGPETYTLTGYAEDPNATNLVTNPAFEDGNTGFSSSFSYTATPITPGSYFITTSPSVVISSFPPCDDHTFGNGTGNMMLVNGTGAPADIWCQTIAVTPNTYYFMSAWVTSSPISPPEMQFSVNATLLGTPYFVGTGFCNWEQFSASWFSGTATSATVCITDQNTSGNGLFGDDFALDDVFFAEACSVSDDVMVDVVEVEAVLPLLTTLPCSALPGGMQLDGSGSSTGPNITYQWDTGDGNIVSGGNTATPTIDAEGTYSLTVTYNDGALICTDFASIQVLPDPNLVVAFAVAPFGIDCNNPTIIIDGNASSQGPTISYSWTPVNGIVFGENTTTPEVNMGGTYTLLVTNSTSGCTATASVLVTEDLTAPTALASVSGELNCIDTVQTLSGSGSSTGSEFSYLWTAGSNGNIVSGDNTLNDCVVNAEGVYTLEVTNNQNGCTAIAFVNVEENFVLPDVTASAALPIDCANTLVVVSGNGSSTGANISYLWTTDDGHIESGENMINAMVDQGGEYILTLTDADSGCEASDTVLVLENTDLPTAFANAPVEITCLIDSVQLDGNGSSIGSDFVYLWTTANGNILSGDTTLSPFVNAAGDYLLTVTDTSNSCTATALAAQMENTNPPLSEAGPAVMIDCDSNPINLDGSGTSEGADFAHDWTTNGGNILNGATTLMPEIDAAGTYFITTTNLLNGCTSLDSVVVSQDGNAPTVMATVSDTLDCITNFLTIDGSGSSSDPNINISWSTLTGNFISGTTTLQPDVDAPGTYILTLTNQTNNCSASTTVEVLQDTLSPTVFIETAGILSCLVETDTLDASVSNQDAVNWTTSDGNIISDANGLNPIVDAPGNYVLTISNSQNGCTASQSIEVFEDVELPTANAGPDQTLTCADPNAVLDGTSSSQGPIFTYQWSSATGNFVSGENSPQPEIDADGIYILEVVNLENGCSASDTVLVDLFSDFPQVDISLPDSLNCSLTEIVLEANASSGPGFSFLWTTSDGNILNGETTLMPTVNEPGEYQLNVLNTTNGCAATATVELFQNEELPTASAGTDFILNCGMASAQLQGTGSSSGSNFTYSWTTADGNILLGETTLSPLINAPGTYTLVVTDNNNSCLSTDDVIVGQDADAPLADAGIADSLTCLLSSLILDGTNSSTGLNFNYLWTSIDGNILSGETTLQPEIDQAGIYLLTVSNTTNNCQTVASVQISDATNGPDLLLENTVILNCIDSILQLSSSTTANNVSYIWTTTNGNILSGANGPNPSIDAVGDYLLMVSDLNTGCTSTASVTATGDFNLPEVLLAAPEILNCSIPFTQLNSNGSSFGNEFIYEWTTLDGQYVEPIPVLMPQVVEAGTYTLTITNILNGCTNSASVLVEKDTIAPDAVANAPMQIGCAQSQVSLDGTGSSVGPNFTYMWTTNSGNILNGETTLSPTVDAAGEYFLQVVNLENGCIAFDTALVTTGGDAPEIVIEQPNELTCLIEEISIDASASSNGPGFTFDWTTLTGNILSGQNSLTPLVNVAADYTLIITDLSTGCTAEAPVTVLENTISPQATAGPDLEINCGEEEIQIQGSIIAPTIADFAWSFEPEPGQMGDPFVSGAQTPIPLVNLPGTYTFIVTDFSNGCSTSDEMVIASNAMIDFSFEIIQPDCETPTGTIIFTDINGGNAPYSYSLDNDLSQPMQTVWDNLEPGAHTLFVQDNSIPACALSQAVEILSYQSFSLSIESEISLSLGESVSLNPQLTLLPLEIGNIVWSPAEGLTCADCLSPVATPVQNTTFLLEVSDLNGCKETVSINLFVTEPSIDVFVPNVFSPNGDGINDLLVIFANENLVKNIKQFYLFSRWGESVFELFDFPPNDVANGWDGKHKGKKMDAGVFAWFLEVELVNGETRLLEGEVVLVK